MDNNGASGWLRAGERLDDLGRRGFRLIQHPAMFCFGMDAVLLAAFARVRPGGRAMDLCCGNGIVSLLMYARNDAVDYYGVDIQEEAVDMARRSVLLNGLDGRVDIRQCDLRDAEAEYSGGFFDTVTVNPPYIPVSSGVVSPESHKAVSRHELLCTMRDVAAAAGYLLKFGGKLYLVNRTNRLTDVLCSLRQYKLEPKSLRFVQTYAGKPPHIFLLSAEKGASPGLNAAPALVINTVPGVYSDEVRRIYYED